MSCKLCLQDKPLRRSHIVPEFMHADMYDEKHRFFGLSSVATRPVELFQKGLRERLLCAECEQQFGRYEHYASRVINGGAQMTVSRNEHSLSISGLDYKPLKLFFMSILWRFGITSLEHFRGTTLGPHAEKLRQMLRTEDPGDYDKYPAVITAVTMERKHIPDLILRPSLARIDHHWIWSLVVGGFLLTFYVSSHPAPSLLHTSFLKPDGTMNLHITEMKDISFLHRFAIQISKAQKIREVNGLNPKL